MVFNSVVFLFCFLPLSLLLYYLVPGRAKNAVLLAESLLFYCWTGVAFLPLIAVLIVFNYLWGLLTARARTTLRGLLPLAAVLVNLGVLVYFKYANFLIDTLNQIGHLGIAALNSGTVLPLGISYYIFKIISYEADVYTGKIEPERNPLTFAVYVLFFPQLIVGPIVKYREMADQLHDSKNRCTMEKAQRGLSLVWPKRSFWRIPSVRCGPTSSAQAVWGWPMSPPRWPGWVFWPTACSYTLTLPATVR